VAQSDVTKNLKGWVVVGRDILCDPFDFLPFMNAFFFHKWKKKKPLMKPFLVLGN
jgi:hypothetical protein